MPYKKAIDVLPPELVDAVSQYLDGGLLYFPKRGQRASWGSQTGSKALIAERDQTIGEAYENGESIEALARRFYLSEERIKKILKNWREQL